MRTAMCVCGSSLPCPYIGRLWTVPTFGVVRMMDVVNYGFLVGRTCARRKERTNMEKK